MPGPRGRTMTVLLAALVLVGGANIAAYAANGSPLLLGHNNTETGSATVKNTGGGPALKLKSNPSTPSLAVSSSKKIPRLNADKVDGLSGGQLQSKVFRYAVPSSGPYTAVTVSFPGLPQGRYFASYTIITTNGGTGPQCFFRQAAPLTAEALSWAVNAGGFSSNTGTGLIDTRGTHGPVTFYCQLGTFSLYSVAGDAESVIAFANVDAQVNHTVNAVATKGTGHGRVTGSR
jgi:hypothetical protein